ncbi:MAG: trehalose-phosphatase, partial [Limisphaerales bacterium]
MKHLSACRLEIQKRVRAARKILLFLDYDGTLVPIRPTPELARLSPERKQLLAGLAKMSKFSAGILTGRSLQDIREAAKVPGLFYAANYGLVIATPKKKWVHPAAKKRAFSLKKMLPRLKELGSEFRGVRVENKTLTVAIHYRQYRGRPGLLKKRLEEIIRAWPGRFKLKTGKMIFEVYPAVVWDKGRALLKAERLL